MFFFDVIKVFGCLKFENGVLFGVDNSVIEVVMNRFIENSVVKVFLMVVGGLSNGGVVVFWNKSILLNGSCSSNGLFDGGVNGFSCVFINGVGCVIVDVIKDVKVVFKVKMIKEEDLWFKKVIFLYFKV